MAVKAGDYPELRLKAWTSRVLCSFLSVCLNELCSRLPNPDEELMLANMTMAKLGAWMLAVERCPRYMSADQAHNVLGLCWEHLDNCLDNIPFSACGLNRFFFFNDPQFFFGES